MSPRTPRQFEEIREEKRSLIMDTALLHFANNGYHATTINNIARHAGISKGLMYFYFKSKEDLLAAIIEKSVAEVYTYFDTNRDNFLTEEEFEYFIRKAARLINEKQSFWRLFFQVLLQKEVREQFMANFLGTESLLRAGSDLKNADFISRIMIVLTDYFERKKQRKEPGYDPFLDMNMFLLTLKGFALTFLYIEEEDEYFEKCISGIISLYK